MHVHDLIVNELFDKKSLAALIFLIDFGRELELNMNEKKYLYDSVIQKKVYICVGFSSMSFGNQTLMPADLS